MKLTNQQIDAIVNTFVSNKRKEYEELHKKKKDNVEKDPKVLSKIKQLQTLVDKAFKLDKRLYQVNINHGLIGTNSAYYNRNQDYHRQIRDNEINWERGRVQRNMNINTSEIRNYVILQTIDCNNLSEISDKLHKYFK